jgi:hypothetical protein
VPDGVGIKNYNHTFDFYHRMLLLLTKLFV